MYAGVNNVPNETCAEIKRLVDEYLPGLIKRRQSNVELEHEKPMVKMPRDYQSESLKWMLKREGRQSMASSGDARYTPECKGGLIGDEMGLGKTYLATYMCLLDTTPPKRRPTLIVTDINGQSNWASVLEAYGLKYKRVDARNMHEDFQDLSTRVYLTTYSVFDFYPRRFIFVDRPSKKKVSKTEGHKLIQEHTPKIHLLAHHYQRIILDEAHNIRNMGSRRQVLDLMKAEVKWCLTATPIHKSVADLFSLLAWVGVEECKVFNKRTMWVTCI